jgi:hypothetical protein
VRFFGRLSGDSIIKLGNLTFLLFATDILLSLLTGFLFALLGTAGPHCSRGGNALFLTAAGFPDIVEPF